MSEHKSTIRFEDLGAPIQKLLRSLKGGLSDDDMNLLEYVSVKDMAKIYNELSTDRQAEQIWMELRASLMERKEKMERKKREKEDALKTNEELQRQAEEEAARLAAEEEEERRRRKEERKRRKEAEAARLAAEEEEAARLKAEEERMKAEEVSAAEEEARKAERKKRKAEEKARKEAEEAARAEEEERLRQEEEERQRKEEKRRRKAEEKKKQLEEEQARLKEEIKQEEKQRKPAKKQKEEWSDYVKSHPLEFANAEEEVEIKQEKVERNTKPPPQATAELLNRVYTPKCPSCGAKYAKPPNEWDCPICLRRLQMKVKCWQPDDEAPHCSICKVGVGRFSRHHCRNCGRVVCAQCSQHKALIPSLGFKEAPVKVCSDCFQLPQQQQAGNIDVPAPTS